MNLKMLLDKQKELDKTILENAGVKDYPMESIKLVLLVELGELANEWQGFKHWKKHKEINRERLLEEFADCFSFALSLENQLHQLDSDSIQSIDAVVSLCDALSGRPYVIPASEIIYAFNDAFLHIVNTIEILQHILCLGRSLNISLDEMEEAYLKKNEVNWQRQQEGY